MGFDFGAPRPVAFFPGTFDPFTLSHKGIVRAIRDQGFEVLLAIDEFSWSKKTQPYRLRRRIAAMAVADVLVMTLYLNPALDLFDFTNRTIFGGVGVLVLVALLLGPMPHVYEVVRRGACHSEAAGNNAENTDEGAESAAAVSLQREELAEAHLDAFASTHRLSPREREILGLISKGRDVPYIEQELVLSKSTVKTHIRHIYEKCEVSSRQALIDLLQSHPGD